MGADANAHNKQVREAVNAGAGRAHLECGSGGLPDIKNSATTKHVKKNGIRGKPNPENDTLTSTGQTNQAAYPKSSQLCKTVKPRLSA